MTIDHRHHPPLYNETGPARVPDMVEGRSKQASKEWLAGRLEPSRKKIAVVVMDGFTEFKTVTTEGPPYEVTVKDPFHVIRS